MSSMSNTVSTPALRASIPSDFDPGAHVTYRCCECGNHGNAIGCRQILAWTRYLWECPHCGTWNARPDAPNDDTRAETIKTNTEKGE